MNRMELDGFVAEVGFCCDVGGDDKWIKAVSPITQKVRQLSRSTSRTAQSAVKTANFSIMTEVSADANANCKGEKSSLSTV